MRILLVVQLLRDSLHQPSKPTFRHDPHPEKTHSREHDFYGQERTSGTEVIEVTSTHREEVYFIARYG